VHNSHTHTLFLEDLFWYYSAMYIGLPKWIRFFLLFIPYPTNASWFVCLQKHLVKNTNHWAACDTVFPPVSCLLFTVLI
jgi:hypothetical protein